MNANNISARTFMLLQKALERVVILPFCLLIAVVAQPSAPSPADSTGSLRGIVLDENGKPLSGATVYGLPETDMRKQFHTKSTSAGEFVLRGLPDGDVFLGAFKESDGYPYNFFSFFLSPGETPVKVRVEAGETLNGIRIQLGKRAARLNIKITTNNGEPLKEGATLVFARPDLPGRYSRGASATESLLVPPVPFQITVIAEGYKAWHYSGNHTGLITLKSGETFDLSVFLEKVQ